MCRFRLRYLFLVFLCIFTLSCSQRDTSSSSTQESYKNYVANTSAGDFAPGQLEAHYLKHGYQFGNITQEEYLENARAFLNTAPGDDVLEKTSSNGDVLHYRVSTGEFAVMSSRGRIRTYFKADYRYWMRQ